MHMQTKAMSRNLEMIHFNLSPDYCAANLDHGIVGVVGRQCSYSS